MKKVKCNKCGFVGDYSEFKIGRDFFQHSFVRRCPKCNNSQNPGDASMRMFGGERPFEFVDNEKRETNPVIKIIKRASSAS